ncbi:MAG TPA: OsmC family protein [Pseudonocardia sp.]|nr:OsmC family protein [Pseudonocardia sp.]
MPEPMAAAHARLVEPAGRATEVRLGSHTLVADRPGAGGGPTPVELLTAALASSSAMAARTHLERGGDPGDVEVVVTLDPGPPPVLYRRVLVAFRMEPEEARRLAGALERTEVSMMLRPAFTVRTQIEHAGAALD